MFFNRRSDRGCDRIQFRDCTPNAIHGGQGTAGGGLHGADASGDFFGALRGALGQVLHLIGDNGEALASGARAGSLNRGIQCQQIGLASDFRDQPRYLADFIHAAGEFCEDMPRLICPLHHAARGFPGA